MASRGRHGGVFPMGRGSGEGAPRNQQKLQKPFLTALQSLLVGDGWFLHVGLYADIAI